MPHAPLSRHPYPRPGHPPCPVEPLERRTLLAVVPSGFADQAWVSGMPTNATSMAFAPDGRLFITFQSGQVRVVRDNALLTTPFLTIPSGVVDAAGERGLLGLAFDPDFATNNFVYVYYTVQNGAGDGAAGAFNRIARFTANGDVAAAGSELVLMNLDPLTGATNHNGGAMHFGPDGKLYIAVGENATPSNSQTLANRHGKMLRINKDGTIPTDNPFYNQAAGDDRSIWAMGLRNPYTFAFQPGTGRMFINDVGDNGADAEKWEEINEGRAGANYGWPTTGDGYFTASQFPQFTNPIHAYNHTPSAIDNRTGRVITGGVFYNPPASAQNFPSEYLGDYFFADYSGSFIRKLEAPQSGSRLPASRFATDAAGPLDLDVGPDGLLYYLSRNGGRVGRVRYTGSLAPVIGTQPANQSVPLGQTATFDVGASGDGTLAYRWQRFSTTANEFQDIPGATSSSYITPATTAADNGARFRVIVTNSFGTATSNEATLTVESNAPPVGTIVTPPEGTRFSAGEAISFSGTATDPEDGNLPAGAFRWEIYYYTSLNNGTGGVRRPYATFDDVTGGTFTIADTGPYTNSDVLYRIEMVAADSQGLETRVVRDVLPRTTTVTLATSVPGLTLNLDGQPQAAPYTFEGVEGFRRTLEAPATQTVGGTTYEFVSWSDGGARAHEIATPAPDTTYTANYRAVASPLVVARHVFYNNSFYDGGDPAAGAADDGAIDTSKRPLTLGNAPEYANVTSYNKGINGIMLDVVGALPSGPPITALNFGFRTGPGDTTWTDGPAPQSVTVRPGAGVSGSDRVTVVFADGVVRDRWLEVRFNFNPISPPPADDDLHYWANLVGESGAGQPEAAFFVSPTDFGATRNAVGTVDVPVTDRFDHNKTGFVSPTDLAITRSQIGKRIETMFPIVTPPPTPPPAPAQGLELEDDDDLLA